MPKGRAWTQEEEGSALRRVFAEQGSITKAVYMAYRRNDEPSVEGMIWRAGGWNSLMEQHGLPAVWRGGVRRTGKKKYPGKPKPIQEKKQRECLKCDRSMLSVHYTCESCRKSNQQFVEDFACL